MAGEISRRRFLGLGVGAGAALVLSQAGCRRLRVPCEPVAEPGVLVNDVHSRLNPTRVRRVARPTSVEEVTAIVRRAAEEGTSVSVAGGRHAAGGQQFLTDGTLIDMRGMDRVLSLDAAAGVVDAEAGILWPALMDDLARRQGPERRWGIVQKQGVDRISLGGSLGANMHGNALGEPPFVAQVASFTLVDACGDVRVCSREENRDLFALALGGYGQFGVVTSIRLRLGPRRRLRVAIRPTPVGEVLARMTEARRDGCLYGDWHYRPDAGSDDFLRTGLLATYRPLADGDDTPETTFPAAVPQDWVDLVTLAHAKPAAAYGVFCAAQLHGHGAVVASDDFQLDRLYVDDYHDAVDKASGAKVAATESLFELFVPCEALVPFLADVRTWFLGRGTAPLYGTVRFVERDEETFLPWARGKFACLVLNLHVTRDAAGIASLRDHFRGLVDVAAAHGGTFYLTYHRFATAQQLDRCHPRLRAFFAEKRRLDPCRVFESDWSRDLAAVLGA